MQYSWNNLVCVDCTYILAGIRDLWTGIGKNKMVARKTERRRKQNKVMSTYMYYFFNLPLTYSTIQHNDSQFIWKNWNRCWLWQSTGRGSDSCRRALRLQNFSQLCVQFLIDNVILESICRCTGILIFWKYPQRTFIGWSEIRPHTLVSSSLAFSQCVFRVG